MTGVKFAIVGGECPIFVFANGEAILRCDKSGCQGAMDKNELVFGSIQISITNMINTLHMHLL